MSLLKPAGLSAIEPDLTKGPCRDHILLYADGGWGKTYSIGQAAKYCRHVLGGKARLYTVSGGGTASAQESVERGYLEVVDPLAYADDVIDILHFASRGHWPAEPGQPMARWPAPKDQPDWPDVKGVFFEDMTEFADGCRSSLLSMEVRKSRLGKGKDAKIFGSLIYETEGGIRYSTSDRSHYGAAQDRIKPAVFRSKRLAGKVVVWTAIPRAVEDDSTGLVAVLGPDVVGKAKTQSCITWFNHVLHGDVSGGSEYTPRLWLRSHPVTVKGFQTTALAKVAFEVPQEGLSDEERKGLEWPSHYSGRQEAHLGHFLREMDRRRASR